jgi:hypothetical protein
MKPYRIRPENTACLHCWFVAAMQAYVAAKPEGGNVQTKLDDTGRPMIDFAGVAEAATEVAAGALKCIQHTHGTAVAVEVALASAQVLTEAAGGDFVREPVVTCDEHATVQ